MSKKRILLFEGIRRKYNQAKTYIKKKCKSGYNKFKKSTGLKPIENISKAFSSFKSKFKKKYGSVSELRFRMNVFLDNSKKIAKHNLNKLKKFTMKVNEYSDLKWDEFKNKVLVKLSPIVSMIKNKKYSVSFSKISYSKLNPKSYFNKNSTKVDWSKLKGSIPNIMYQGECGSCFAFATSFAISNAIWRKKRQSVKLSIQEILSCSSVHEYGNQGCNGGVIDSALRYVIEKGVTNYGSNPYIGKVSSCKKSK